MIIDFNSIPVYNYSYVANALTPSAAIYTDVVRKETVWTCTDWVTFFEALKGKYGEAKAKEQWSYWWNLGQSIGSGGAGSPLAGSGLVYDSVPLDCRTTNSAFRGFIAKYKLSDVIYKGLGNIAKPLGVVTDVVSSVEDAASTVGKILKIAIPVLLITGVGLLILYGYKKAQHA